MDKIDCEKKITNGILEHRCDSWEEFGEFVADSNHCPATCIFRGQADSKWLVESTLDRMEKRFPTKPNNSSNTPTEYIFPRVERKLQLDRFKEMSRGKLTNPPNKEDEWWTLAQHHGLATPMLDWTYFPFVALFFAFEDEKCWCKESKDYKEPKSRAVFALKHHLIRKKGGGANDKSTPRPFSPKGYANYRVVNQGGVFLRMPEPEYEDEGGKQHIIKRYIDLETYVCENFTADTYREEPDGNGKKNTNPRAVLQKVIMPNKGRVECLKFLDHMNINRSSLFPDLDGAARYVNDLWEVNFDKAIGHINPE